MFSLSLPQETCFGDHPGAHERAVFMLKAKFEGTPALSCPIKDMGQAMGTLGRQHDIQQGSCLGKLEMKI